MRTWEYLFDPVFGPPIATALAIAVLCAWLSVIVVLKRLAFIGQGISHAALGGVGVAVMAGSLGWLASAGAEGFAGKFGIVLAFCLASAMLIAWMSERRTSGRKAAEADTIIGIVLVASMSLGALLLHGFSRTSVSWESFLFGSILDSEWLDAKVSWAVAGFTLLTLWWVRRPLTFWAFDGASAQAMGVRGGGMNFLLMLLLSLATVTAMKLAGVVLATAMLVLPGAVALRLSDRRGPVLVLAMLAALVGVVGGLELSFRLDWLPGAAIVCVLSGMFFAAWGWSRVRG